MSTRIENAKFGKSGCCILSSFFVFTFLLFIVIGSAGPRVLVEHTGKYEVEPELDTDSQTILDATFTHTIKDLTRESQYFWLDVEIFRSKTMGKTVSYRYKQKMVTTVVGVKNSNGQEHFISQGVEHNKIVICHADKSTCRPITIMFENDIKFDSYYVEIKFINPYDTDRANDDFQMLYNVHAVNPTYTNYELGWKGFFAVISLLSTMIYYKMMYSVKSYKKTYQQKWVQILSFFLIFYNDPFFFIEVYSDATDMFSGLKYALAIAFNMLILMWILCVFDETRLQGYGSDSSIDPRSLKQLLPRSLLLIVLYICTLGLLIHSRLAAKGDPSYSFWEDMSEYKGFGIFMILCSFIYLANLVYYIVGSIESIRRLSQAYLFLFFVTFIAIIILCVGLFMGSSYLIPSNSCEFLTFYALPNLYILTLMIAYSPVEPSSSHNDRGHEDENEDEEEEIEMAL